MEPAIIKNDHCVYIAFPLFKAYADYGYTVYRDILSGCIDLLYSQKCMVTNVPAITELTLRKQERKYLVHMLNYVVQKKAKLLSTVEEKYTVHHCTLGIKTSFSPAIVKDIRNNKIVNFSYRNGYTEIEIEQETGYKLYCIE